MPPVLCFEVRGKPVPQGAIRHFGAGRPSVHANQERLLPWREAVQHAAEATLATLTPEAQKLYPLSGPVRLDAWFTMPKPTSAPRTRTTYPTTRPDMSHLVRAVEDALTAAGVWTDDKLVVDGRSCKVFPDEEERSLHVPGVRIEVCRVALMVPASAGPRLRSVS
jgi:Holliday junction resolvase RusA-like endonuclease